MREWRRRSIESGYGKWLYKHRKLLRENVERYQLAVVDAIHALEQDVPDVEAALTALIRAMNDADEAEQNIEPWGKKGDE